MSSNLSRVNKYIHGGEKLKNKIKIIIRTYNEHNSYETFTENLQFIRTKLNKSRVLELANNLTRI